jgi:transposase
VRVTTAFNRALKLPGTVVSGVEFTEEGLVLSVRRTRRRHECPCGQTTTARYDCSRRRWRHLDFGATRVWLEADIARVDCRGCGRVRTETVPWARPRARHTRDFEDVVAWLAQRMDKTAVAELMHCSWASVDRIVGLVVAEHIDDSRLDGLTRIGVDEISYRLGHKYLTLVVDHDSGRVVWAAQGKDSATLGRFFDALGPNRSGRLQAVTMDLGAAYRGETMRRAPQAAIVADPFHVIAMATKALDSVFRGARVRFPDDITHNYRPNRRIWAATRLALRKGAERLSESHHALLAALRHGHEEVYRAWQLKERLRDLYRIVEPTRARRYLQRWIRDAFTSGIRPMSNLAGTVLNHLDHIINAVTLGLSNSRSEGINGKVRLIQRRGYGHHSAQSLIEMVYLCCSGITIQLPTQR